MFIQQISLKANSFYKLQCLSVQFLMYVCPLAFQFFKRSPDVPPTLYAFLSVSVRICLFLSFSVCFCPVHSGSLRFCLFLSVSLCFCPFLSVSVRFCQFLSVSVHLGICWVSVLLSAHVERFSVSCMWEGISKLFLRNSDFRMPSSTLAYQLIQSVDPTSKALVFTILVIV